MPKIKIASIEEILVLENLPLELLESTTLLVTIQKM